jgi:restriction system protein
MDNSTKKISQSDATWAKVMFAAFEVLKENGGQLSWKEISEEIKKKITFNERENFVYEKTGYIRRRSLLQFYSVDSVKTGFFIKKKWIRILTEEGEKAMQWGAINLMTQARIGYKSRLKTSDDKKTENNQNNEDIIETEEWEERLIKTNLEQLEGEAQEGLMQFLSTKNPYEFQDIVAALLRAMWYHTPFIAPKWKDGWIDIVAYQDPLWVKPPRIKVQVKHYFNTTVWATDVRELRGLLNRDSEVGIFVTSWKFSSDAIKETRSQGVHVELIDVVRFIELWKSFYNKMPDEDKNLLPLYPIYFVWSNE